MKTVRAKCICGKAGKAYWLSTAEGQKRHADVNTGTKPVEVMVMELKKAK